MAALSVVARPRLAGRPCPRCEGGQLLRERFTEGPRTGWVCLQCGFEEVPLAELARATARQARRQEATRSTEPRLRGAA